MRRNRGLAACLALLLTALAPLWAADRTAIAAGQPEQHQAVPADRSLRALIEADWIQRDEAFPGQADVAERSPQPNDSAVTTTEDAAGGCDGVTTGRCGFHTASRELDPWWQVDLGSAYELDRVVIYNRTDGNTAPRTRHIRILVSDDARSPDFTPAYQHQGDVFYGVAENKPLTVSFRGQHLTARIVRLLVPGRCSFALDEVEVYARDAPQTNVALGKPADQKSISPYSSRSPKAAQPPPPKPRVSSKSRFQFAHIRQVIDRAQRLAARLEQATNRQRLAELVAGLENLHQRLEELGKHDRTTESARRALYLEARWLARKIAFCNPALDFDKILFVKRHHPGGLYHMVHQYYGFGAVPGGGLFVLSDPFSDHPRITNLLAGSHVANGRLKGRELTGGAFLSPDLSYDGTTVAFAHAECGAEGIEWSPRSSFHLFKVKIDGSELIQLTDGSWNDFDPCFLPNGRIAFVSERRGGYLRCGGSAPPYDSPTYTLHSLAERGDDIVCLSFHETQEWHPSVTNDGMIAYTRWDYVDRDTNVAHHMWTCYPDGRDPRSFHGNYPERRESRPWMEMSIRAVPGSHKFVATAAAHHGHAFGSLVLIDPHVPDDGGMSQLTRLTPDVRFPESEGGKPLIRQRMAYGTAWPLSEKDYLCVYDVQAENHGIYWIDGCGNKELLYRDPSIPCLSPIPLRTRRRPPVIPDRTASLTTGAIGSAELLRPATVAVANVYDSDFAWPNDVQVAALRIVHVLPKTTPPSNQPRIGIGTQTNARAVLGTVPVEADGSAFFEVPAGRTVYFQALDQRGMAVQSMRSGTYLHAGEQLACQGCHEAKHRPPASSRGVPLALQRPPSRIRPDVDGSNPFNYVRLVQPVLDRHCVECHTERGELDLSGEMADQYGWTRSYASLAGKYGFYYHVTNGSIKSGIHGGSRTLPGKFGARAAPLLAYLDESHYGVELPEKDFHRLVLWLDCNSEFFGAYENTEAQSRGDVVHPTLD